MGLFDWLKSDDSPFEQGVVYYNDDYDGKFVVTSLDPFRIELDGLPGEKKVSKDLYIQKFRDGRIRKL